MAYLCGQFSRYSLSMKYRWKLKYLNLIHIVITHHVILAFEIRPFSVVLYPWQNQECLTHCVVWKVVVDEKFRLSLLSSTPVFKIPFCPCCCCCCLRVHLCSISPFLSMEPPSVHSVSVFMPMIFDDINQLLCHFKSTLHFIWSDNFILQMLYPQCDCRHQLERTAASYITTLLVSH